VKSKRAKAASGPPSVGAKSESEKPRRKQKATFFISGNDDRRAEHQSIKKVRSTKRTASCSYQAFSVLCMFQVLFLFLFIVVFIVVL